MTEKREKPDRREVLKQAGKVAVAAPAVVLLFSATKASAVPNPYVIVGGE